jgi:hypothetical protein
MADFPVQLAQLIAQNRATQQPHQIQQPSVPQLNALSATGVGWGPVGEQFGKGVGDYIKSTYAQAQKNKYLQANDPIEIQKRAKQMFDLYQTLGPEEQKRMDDWFNNTAEGLSELKRFQSAAPGLMTKEPRPEGEILPPGASRDDREMVRFIRVPPSEASQKAQALYSMRGQAPPQAPIMQPPGAPIQPRADLAIQPQAPPQGQAPMDLRNQLLFSKENVERAQVPYYQSGTALHEAQTADTLASTKERPQRLDLARREVVAREIDSRASLLRAKTDAGTAGSIREMNFQHARYFKALADNKGMDPALTLQAKLETQKEIGKLISQYGDHLTKYTLNPNASTQENALLIRDSLNTAALIKSMDPEHPGAPTIFNNAKRGLLTFVADYRKRSKAGSLSDSLNHTFDQNGTLARELVDAWSSKIATPQEALLFAETYKALAENFWEQMLPPEFLSAARAHSKKGGPSLESQVGEFIYAVYENMRTEGVKRVVANQIEKKKLGGGQ